MTDQELDELWAKRFGWKKLKGGPSEYYEGSGMTVMCKDVVSPDGMVKAIEWCMEREWEMSCNNNTFYFRKGPVGLGLFTSDFTFRTIQEYIKAVLLAGSEVPDNANKN